MGRFSYVKSWNGFFITIGLCILLAFLMDFGVIPKRMSSTPSYYGEFVRYSDNYLWLRIDSVTYPMYILQSDWELFDSIISRYDNPQIQIWSNPSSYGIYKMCVNGNVVRDYDYFLEIRVSLIGCLVGAALLVIGIVRLKIKDKRGNTPSQIRKNQDGC